MLLLLLQLLLLLYFGVSIKNACFQVFHMEFIVPSHMCIIASMVWFATPAILKWFYCCGGNCLQTANGVCMSASVCLSGRFLLCSSLPLLAWLSCCLVGLLAGCLLGWLARLVGSLAGLLVGWLPGCLVGWLVGWFASWLLGWQVACFNCCFALHFSQWFWICLPWLPLCLCLGHKFGNGNLKLRFSRF